MNTLLERSAHTTVDLVDLDQVEGAAALTDLYRPIACFDASELSRAVQGWNLEFTQLSPGPFVGIGAMLELDCALVARVASNQALVHRGWSPRGSVAVLIPGRGCGNAILRGRQLEPAQCVAIADGACMEVITQRRHVNVALAIDLDAWNSHSHWLSECSLFTLRGITVESPGKLWIDRMLNAVEYMYAAVEKHPDAFDRPGVRASLRDQFLMAMAGFGSASDGAEQHCTRSARAQQRIAVERAREYIRENLAEPLPLSKLCSYAHVQARSLEYGFREITGLAPIAYIKAMRLNAVRRLLLRTPAPERSISEIALDNGFWHLSQFTADYRKFFGETPTSTRNAVLKTCSTV